MTDNAAWAYSCNVHTCTLELPFIFFEIKKKCNLSNDFEQQRNDDNDNDDDDCNHDSLKRSICTDLAETMSCVVSFVIVITKDNMKSKSA